MYCMKCGKEIDDTAKFCDACGHKVGSSISGHETIQVNIDKEGLKNAFEQGKKNGIGLFRKVKGKINIPLNELISLIIMVFSILLCLSDWFKMPHMGTYTPLQWKNFMDTITYYSGSTKVYDRANIIPGMFIWVNLPLIMYAINAFIIIFQKKSKVGLEIMGIVFSLGIFFYAKYLFTYYNSYLLGNYGKCSMGISFYLMIILVIIDVIRIHKKNEKDGQQADEKDN